MSDDVKSVIDEFHEVVCMTPKELETWLDTEESSFNCQWLVVSSELRLPTDY